MNDPIAAPAQGCPEKRKPGGCQLPNVHCGYPECDKAAPAQGEPQDYDALIYYLRNPPGGYISDILKRAAAAIAALRAERDALREDADYVLRMLDAAKCPTCDGGGTTLYGDQCEWCFSRQVACAPLNAAIDAARAGK